MTDKPQHTKTPWKSVGFCNINGKERGFMIKFGDTIIVAKILANDHSSAQCKANAAYICLAVNSHEKLVSALRSAEIQLVNCLPIGKPNNALHEIRAVLAELEKERV